MKSQLLTLMLAAAISTGALVGGCGAADETSNKEAESPASQAEAADANAAAPASSAEAQKSEPEVVVAANEGEEKEADAPAPAAEASGDKKKMSLIDRVNSAEKGTLKNPFDWKDPKIAEEGHKAYMGLSCNGCHGGGGGGGMCPPLTNETWVYGGDDDTLFRLIALGSQDLQKEGYARKGQEGVVGPMPGYKDIVDDEDRIWKAIAWIRSVWGGREEKINW